MRKFLWIVLLFISANIFAQDKNEFFVKNNGDTVYCKIMKVDFDRLLFDTSLDKKRRNIWNGDMDFYPLNNIKVFRFRNVVWRYYDDIDLVSDSIKSTYIFLPDTSSGHLRFTDWVIRVPKNQYLTKIWIKSDGKTTLYEVRKIYNGGYSTGLYLKNDSLGLARIFFAKKRGSEANEEIKKILRTYTSDKSWIVKSLDDNFFADYVHVKRYLDEYIGGYTMKITY